MNTQLTALEVIKSITEEKKKYESSHPLNYFDSIKLRQITRVWHIAVTPNSNQFKALHENQPSIYQFHYDIKSKEILDEILSNLKTEHFRNENLEQLFPKRDAPTCIFVYCFE
jgi:hypothetical protein